MSHECPLEYFYEILPKILDHEGQNNLNCIKCLQRSGETIFVPGGWWYAQITIEDSMSVTQKFISPLNFQPFWKSLRCTRTKLSEFLLKVLKDKDQYLYDSAIELNARDNFRMRHDKTANKIKFAEDLTTTTYVETPTASQDYSPDYSLSEKSRDSDCDSETGKRRNFRRSYSPGSRSRERLRKEYKGQCI